MMRKRESSVCKAQSFEYEKKENVDLRKIITTFSLPFLPEHPMWAGVKTAIAAIVDSGKISIGGTVFATGGLPVSMVTLNSSC